MAAFARLSWIREQAVLGHPRNLLVLVFGSIASWSVAHSRLFVRTQGGGASSTPTRRDCGTRDARLCGIWTSERTPLCLGVCGAVTREYVRACTDHLPCGCMMPGSRMGFDWSCYLIALNIEKLCGVTDRSTHCEIFHTRRHFQLPQVVKKKKLRS